MSPSSETPEPEVEQATVDASPEEYSGKTTKLKYSGPDGQQLLSVGMLKKGKTYEVPKELVDGLISGSTFWEKA